MAIFSLGEEIHHAGDMECPECWEEYPEPCMCGGLIHAAVGEGEDPEGNVWLITQCDKCGRSEDELAEEAGERP